MRHFNLILIFAFSLFWTAPVSAQRNTSPQEQYVIRYAPLAVAEMYRSGVPASITLAQGLLESRYGLSELAVSGNNHFGIKCHNNWRGGKIYHDDDRRGECFRKYDSPEESFRDHSDFLRYRDRYKFLFDLQPTDYKGWAYGLKKAGYATDPSYPAKLVRLIEEYDLHEYDRLPVDFWTQPDRRSDDRYGDRHDGRSDRDGQHQDVNKDRSSREDRHLYKGKSKKKARSDSREAAPAALPESPTKIEAIKLLDESRKGEFSFPLSRQMYSLNGVPFVYSTRGETYASIAKAFNLFPKEILRLNDLNPGTDVNTELIPGTLIYVQPKKNEAAKGLEKHVIEKGDTLRALSQRYGVKLKKLLMMNGLSADDVLREGDIISLRK